MRLWSIHPKYLDAKGLVALWREALLAQKVLRNRTRGYKNHPQVIRFRQQPGPVNAINNYLKVIWAESRSRNYNFDSRKIGSARPLSRLPVTRGQIQFEFAHLLKKLRSRDFDRYHLLKGKRRIEVHNLFKMVPGEIEPWEKMK